MHCQCRIWGVILLLLTAMLMDSCGYSFRTRRNTLEEDGIRTVYIEKFSNNSIRPDVGMMVTNSIIREFARTKRVRLVTDRSQADAILSGTVTAAGSNVGAPIRTEDVSSGRVTGSTVAQSYNAFINCTMKLVRVKDKRDLWGSSFGGSQGYTASNFFGARGETNGSINTSEEKRAFDVIASQLAIDSHDAIFDRF